MGYGVDFKKAAAARYLNPQAAIVAARRAVRYLNSRSRTKKPPRHIVDKCRILKENRT
jgi:hypothetical protein